MTDSVLRVDSKLPIITVIALVASMSASFAVTQYQVQQLNADLGEVKADIKEIENVISGVDVLNNKMDNLLKYVDRMDRRLSQVDALKIK